MTVNTCVKNMETLSLPLDPSPSGPLLQGGSGFSHSSSEKLVIKEMKMREKERKRDLVRQASQKFNKKKFKSYKSPLLQSVVWALNTTKQYKLPN